MRIAQHLFGTMHDGEAVTQFTLSNDNGMVVKIINFGCIITEIHVPDKDGNTVDVALGFDNLDQYLAGHPCFGAFIGRYGNRIAKGRFSLNGIDYVLAQNNGENHLHGGNKALDEMLWEATEAERNGMPGVILRHTSPDGNEGYPGTLNCEVRYWLSNDNALIIEYEATTDKPTIVNFTNHSYFNLAGEGKGDVLGHVLMINADAFTPVDEGLIPTGEIRSLDGSPLDFRTPTAIGERIERNDEQMRIGTGYDHNYVLNREVDGLSLAARAKDPGSGRVMECYTTEPGMQLYTGNFLGGNHTGKSGMRYKDRYGFCFETQHYPDSPNKPEFPSTELNPGETYQSTTIYKFLAE